MGLLLEIGYEGELPGASLKLYEADRISSELGYFDTYNDYPCALRWEEVEKLGDYLAPQVPDCPAAPFLLLSLFGVVSGEDDLDKVRDRIVKAWRSLGLFPEEFIQEVVVNWFLPI